MLKKGVEGGEETCWLTLDGESHVYYNFVLIPRATPLHSFVDYVKGGCEISLMAAIDFTVSTPVASFPCLPCGLGTRLVHQIQ